MYLKKTYTYSSILILMSLLTFVPENTKADSLDVSISQQIVLTSESFASPRIIIRFNFPSELDSAEIVIAQLFIPFSASIIDSNIYPVYCAPLLTQWQQESMNWETVGDSVNSEMVSLDQIDYPITTSGAQLGYFNITDYIRKLQRGDSNNGFIIFTLDSKLYLDFDNTGIGMFLRITYEPK
jgi:hypothetical protein